MEEKYLLKRFKGYRAYRKRSWKLIDIKSEHVREQVSQVIKDLHLNISAERLFCRCSICNTPLDLVINKELIKKIVPKYVFETQEEFSYCTKCNKAYWQGTHKSLLYKVLDEMGIKLRKIRID